MKKILFLSTFITVCCAFAAAKYTKQAPIAEETTLAEPPSIDVLTEPERAQNDKYNKEDKFNGEATFEELLAQFSKGTLPYSLTTNVLRRHVDTMAYAKYRQQEKKVLPRAFHQYFPSLESERKFSRMPPPLPEPFLAFEANGKHVLIYFTNRFGKSYYVSTFDAKGKLISEKPFAEVNLEEMTIATLEENLELTRIKYDIIWNKKQDENGYKNCKITELKLIKKTVESLIKKNSEKEIKIEKNTIDRVIP
jgi:hypothetical protein